MATVKTLAVAATLFLSAASFAMAQNPTPSGPPGNPANNAASSGGSGTHRDAMKTGSAESNQKILGNQNGYRHLGSRHRHYHKKMAAKH